ncbi:TraR/DksA C4-type zinc finger protein [uncultured Akkermansia sp.]|nr:TraR/DksA C4-type zinc finger protein [uncultured Akkermansia sp.]
MPTPKKTNSKTVAKEVPAPKKKTCGKSGCKTAVDLEAPAKKKCCRKKASEPEKAASPAKSNASAAVEVEKKPAPKTVKKAPVKKIASAPVAPVPTPAKNELTDEQAEAIAAAKAELAANPEWEPFVQMQRQHLMDLRDRALDSMSGVARDTLRNHPEGSEASGSGEHQADAGSDAYDRDFALSLLSKEQDGLYEIEQALARIDNGTYGICEMSYKVIPILRLEAIPFARLTVECQAQWEKEKGQNARFRPRVALGFAGGQNDVDLSVSLDDDEE